MTSESFNLDMTASLCDPPKYPSMLGLENPAPAMHQRARAVFDPRRRSRWRRIERQQPGPTGQLARRRRLERPPPPPYVRLRLRAFAGQPAGSGRVGGLAPLAR